MGHRTPSYVVARLRQMARERRRPDEPWWTDGAVALVDRWLGPEDVVVEFGSGRSTAWLAKRAQRVVSLEHHAEWHAKVSKDLASLSNAEVRLVPDEPEAYASGADDVASPTLVVVDGRHRDWCARWAMSRLASGGGMLLDDSQRYLDDAGRFTRASVPRPAPRSAMWDELLPELRRWRRLTYCDGVSDTTLLLKP
ncbi:MAG: hypothetical protein ACTS22_07895 [Phycisphaerales bacterium]